MCDHWIDNADSYICPKCGLEVNSPANYEGCKCPRCSFQDPKDANKKEEKSLKFAELFNLIPETQEVHLIFADCGIVGTGDSFACLLNDDAYNAKVINVEAASDKLKVWIEVDE